MTQEKLGKNVLVHSKKKKKKKPYLITSTSPYRSLSLSYYFWENVLPEPGKELDMETWLTFIYLKRPKNNKKY